MKAWKATSFNAKVETAYQKPTFRDAWTNGRCLIPATGYYEWTGAKGAKKPWFIQPVRNSALFSFAGLRSQLASGLETCTILTRAADPEIAHFHARMPIIVPVTSYRDWLDAAAPDADVIEEMGTGWSYDRWPVRPFGIHDDGPELIERDGLAL